MAGSLYRAGSAHALFSLKIVVMFRYVMYEKVGWPAAEDPARITKISAGQPVFSYKHNDNFKKQGTTEPAQLTRLVHLL